MLSFANMVQVSIEAVHCLLQLSNSTGFGFEQEVHMTQAVCGPVQVGDVACAAVYVHQVQACNDSTATKHSRSCRSG